jgi:hypothetical protein
MTPFRITQPERGLVKPRRAPQAIDFLNFTGMTSRLGGSRFGCLRWGKIMPSGVAERRPQTPSEFVRLIDREHDGLRPPGGAT